jgi:hypothetical protein
VSFFESQREERERSVISVIMLGVNGVEGLGPVEAGARC